MTSSRGCDLKHIEELQAGGFLHVVVLLIAITWGSLLPSYAKAATEMDYDFNVQQREKEAAEARATSRFAVLLTDYFSRYNRDDNARAEINDIQVDENWKILLADDADPLAVLMSHHFVEFMGNRMGVPLNTKRKPRTKLSTPADRTIVFAETGGGDPHVPESFALAVTPAEIRLTGQDPAGFRDGIVKLIDLFGFRESPILPLGKEVYRPKIPIRFGAHGSARDNILMGYNAFTVGGTLYASSTSRAISELIGRQRPGALQAALDSAKEARRYGMKIYFNIESSGRLAPDDPIYQAHPEIRGAKTHWSTVLCTQHPLVKRYLSETVEGILRADPGLSGISFIVGGEAFYHCFMRPEDSERGHTNCKRCEEVGAKAVVADLCNSLAEAVRRVNPSAEVHAWLYSAYVWSADPAQEAFIALLKPGTAIRTDVVKDELMIKPGGVRKTLWDYSIDLIGPGTRANKQLEACNRAGIPIHFLTMSEDSVEYPGVPHYPCMDRWFDRGESLAVCGASGVLGSHFGNYDASSASEVFKHLWWDPSPGKEEFLQRFASRLAGTRAGPYLRKAWKHVSDAFDHSTQIGDYYFGPHHIGPAHPMCADLEAELPRVFYGTSSGKPLRPVFKKSPTLTMAEASPEVVIAYSRRMKESLELAIAELAAAKPLVPERCRLMFEAEESVTRWFYHTVRTEANFNESCLLRDHLLALAMKEDTTPPTTCRCRTVVESVARSIAGREGQHSRSTTCPEGRHPPRFLQTERFGHLPSRRGYASEKNSRFWTTK